MNYEEFKKLVAENSNSIEFGEFGTGVSDDWIEKAEDRLGVEFPASYVWWLKNYGGGEIHGDEVFSLYEEDFDTVIGGDIVYMNELNWRNGTTHSEQLVIQENDQGEVYYFKLDEKDESGEYPIYLDPVGNCYASNFLEFVSKKCMES